MFGWDRGYTSDLLECGVFAYALVHGEAVVDAGRQRDQVPLVHGDADPPVPLVPDVKVGLAVQDVADLIVRVQVLCEEHLQLQDATRHDTKIILTSLQINQ